MHSLEVELQKKKDEAFNLKYKLWLVEEMNKIKNEEIAFLAKQLKKLKEK